MLKIILFVVLIMAGLLIVLMFLAAQFLSTLDGFFFGQGKLECKPCICHPECHCETKCIQQQIMKECNLGVDSHNALVSHHTQENRTTRFILIFSLTANFFLILLLLCRKPVRHCYRTHRIRKQQQKTNEQEAAARQQTDRYTIALKKLFAPHLEQHPPQQTNLRATSDQPIFQLLSTLPLADNL